MVNPFILQATDAMTRIILGIHTLLLGTGGRGCGGPGIRTITATGCRERDTHRRAYGADAGRGGTPRRNRRCCRPCRFAHLYRCSPRRSDRKRRYRQKMPIQNFFSLTISLTLNEWRFNPKTFTGGIEYTQLKHANYGAGNSDGFRVIGMNIKYKLHLIYK